MKINNRKKSVSLFNGLLFCILLFATWSLSGQQAKATEAIDQQQTAYNDYIGPNPVGQTFIPAATNITKITINACSAADPYRVSTTTLYLCFGTPDYATPNNNLNCGGAGQTKITQSTLIISCGLYTGFYDYIFNQSLILTPDVPYFFVVDDPGNITIRGSATNYYANGNAFSGDGQAATKDLYFKTWYDSGDPTITIGAPTFNQTYADNFITFYGTTTNADSFGIYWGPLNTTPGNQLYGQSIYNRKPVSWNFEAQIPDGAWTIWHVAKQGTTTVISSSTIYIANQYGQNEASPISSSTMATTSAYNTLTNVATECGSSAPAYIYNPSSFWASNTPEILTNGTESASTSPFLYQVITTPLYSIGKGPIDIGNKVSCYLSTQNAGTKGQALAITLLAYANMLSGLNSLFFGNFPIGILLLIWGIGMILWMLRKVMPFGK